MAARSTSRFKQKPAVPFGDFMLPILGVVALGIVVVGIRLLWAPNPPKPTVITQPRPIAQHQSAGIVAGKKAGAEDGVVTKKEKIDNVIIAQPVQRKSDSRSQTENRPGTPSGEGGDNASQKSPSQPRAARVEPKKGDAAPGENRVVVRGGSIDKSLFIIQCGSYTDRAAANAVVSSLQKMGHSAVVRQAEVRGKNYYRVIVAGGRDRAVADEIAKDIKAAGHPVLVRQNQ
ncbi:SPOR domain-containing protein [Pyramidobacter piscolens]|nr:SPOR domain-containing protein [Pyramidobacter piscolens]BDF78268.1 hypothetical protein CE91St28_10620 [Pyramidobacter piscolens]